MLNTIISLTIGYVLFAVPVVRLSWSTQPRRYIPRGR